MARLSLLVVAGLLAAWASSWTLGPAPLLASASAAVAVGDVSADAAVGAAAPWQGLPLLSWRGRVLDAEGAPLPSAQAWLIPNGRTLQRLGYFPRPYAQFIGLGSDPPHRLDYAPLERMPHAVSDADGRFVLEAPRLPMRSMGGTFAFGLPDPVLVITAPGHGAAIRRIEPWREGCLDLGSVSLREQGVCVGEVLDASGMPLAGAVVRAEYGVGYGVGYPQRASEGISSREVFDNLRAVLPELHEVTTDVQGRFRIEGLFPATYTLGALAPGHVRARVAWVEVAEGALASGVVFRLEPAAPVAGRVLDAAGAPVADLEVLATTRTQVHAGQGCVITPITDEHDGIPIEVLQVDRWDAVVTRTDADGAFRLGATPPGALSLYAHGPGWEVARVRGVTAAEQPIELVIQPAARLELKLRSQGSEPQLLDPWILARRITGTGDNVPLQVLPGQGPGEFVVVGVGPLGTELLLHAPGHASQQAIVTAEQAAQSGPALLELARAWPLQAVVLDQAGLPRAGVVVSLSAHGVRSDGSMSLFSRLRSVSGERGRVTFADIPASVYRLNVERLGSWLLVGESVVVDMPSGQPLSGVELVVEDTGSIEVTALYPDGRPAEDCVVAVLEPGVWRSGLLKRELKLASRGWNFSRDDGTARITRLPAGEYDVSVDYEAPVRVSVTAGESSEITLRVDR